MIDIANNDRESLAWDFVAACARLMVTLAAALLAAACAADPASVEAGLWEIGRSLKAFVPALDMEGGSR